MDKCMLQGSIENSQLEPPPYQEISASPPEKVKRGDHNERERERERERAINFFSFYGGLLPNPSGSQEPSKTLPGLERKFSTGERGA
eukprot:5351095-Ditylum_brightwellii.AAC.1